MTPVSPGQHQYQCLETVGISGVLAPQVYNESYEGSNQPLTFDLNGNCRVDLSDFAMFAGAWLN